MRRLLLVLVLAVTAVVVPPLPRASACSCMQYDVRESLGSVDGAIVGTLLFRDDPAPVDGLVSNLESVRYRYRVDRVVKGDIGTEEVDIWSAADGAACGLERPVGHPTGLLLRRDGQRWTSNLCSQVMPDMLVRASQPLPPPPGKGPPSVLVGTTHGPGRLVSLDASGAVVAYGPGEGVVTEMAFCPGGARLVEAYTFSGADFANRPGVAVRSTADDLAVVWQRPLSDEQSPYYLAVADVACRDEDASPVLVLETQENYAGTQVRHDAKIVALRAEGAPEILWEGEATSGTFSTDGTAAYLNGGPDGRDLLVVDLVVGPAPDMVRTLGRLPADTGPLVLAPDGRHLAGVTTNQSWTGGAQPGTKAVMVDITRTPAGVVETNLGQTDGSYRAAVWADPDRVVLAPTWGDHPVRVFDPALTAVASWTGWGSSSATVVGDRLIGLAGPKVRTAALTTGPSTEWADLESGIPGTIVAFPQAPAIEEGTSPASTTTTTKAREETTPSDEAQPVAPVEETPEAEPGNEPAPTTAPDSAPGVEAAAPSAPDGGGTGGRPILMGGAGAAVLAAAAAAFLRRRRLPTLP